MGRHPGRRSIAIASMVVGLACVALPTLAQQPDVVLIFSGDGESHALGFSGRFAAGPPIPLEAFVARTSGHVDSQPRAAGLAATASMPLVDLLVTSGGGEAPPTSCVSNFPGDDAADCGGGERVSTDVLEIAVASAATESHGVRDDPDATSSFSNVSLGGASLEVVAVGTATSDTSLEIVDGQLVVRTRSVVEDVVVAGVLKIGAVELFAEAVAGGDPGTASSSATVSYSDVSVMDVPVRLTATGLEVADTSVPLPLPLGDPLAPLTEAGITIAAPGTVEEVDEDGTAATARAEGPVVIVRNDLGDDRIELQLGTAIAQANLARQERMRFQPLPAAPTRSASPDAAPTPPVVCSVPHITVDSSPEPPALTTTAPAPDSVPMAVVPSLPLAERVRTSYAWSAAGVLLLVGGLVALYVRAPRFEGLQIHPSEEDWT